MRWNEMWGKCPKREPHHRLWNKRKTGENGKKPMNECGAQHPFVGPNIQQERERERESVEKVLFSPNTQWLKNWFT